MDESKILILYCGGTLGMVRHPSHGYVPYPGFLSETLRTQSRFHDPNEDSIFSWSDTTERYKAWTDAYSSQPASGSNTPNRPGSPRTSARASPLVTSLQDTSNKNLLNSSPHLQEYCAPVKVLSSERKATFTKNAIKSRLNEKGQLELMLPTMITPATGRRRTRYAVLEYDPLLDSSNIETKDWLRLAADIQLNYQSFDAFVILHGTDTMSYTSSALSMLLENLGKPVVVTGAQVPLSELRNDAIENVLGALLIASTHPIPEVTLFFSSTLFRGNRVSKLSNSSLHAFDSPNLPPLGTAGITINLNTSLILKPRHLVPFRAHDRMSQQVVLLRLFPGLQVDTIRNFFAEPIQGVILHSFGAGNAPTKPELLDVFSKATHERDIVIVNISQCIRGEVSAIYQVGKQLQSVGVVAGGDMTPECALAKLSYLLAKNDLSRQEIRKLMGKSLRGELTERQPELAEESSAPTPTGGQVRRLLEHILVQEGQPSSSVDEDMDDMALMAERSFLPHLIQRACQRGDVNALRSYLDRQKMLDSLPQLARPDGDSASVSSAAARTHAANPVSSSTGQMLPPLALHIAAASGYAEQVRLLLEAGYLVHVRDYAGNTPLFVAARNGHTSCVKLLRSAGAHLASDEVRLARYLSTLPDLNTDISVNGAEVDGEMQKRAAEIWSAAGLVA